MNRFARAGWVLLATMLSVGLPAAEPESTIRQIWQQIDYVGVDYAGAVDRGQVTNPSEYAEMREFSNNALRQTEMLTPRRGRDDVIEAVSALNRAVEQRTASSEVNRLAQRAAATLLATYPVPVVPLTAPDVQRGANIFQARCATCHGITGRADGPLAAQLNPKPVAFVDHSRARARSVLALYQIITQGVSGTSMPSFSDLPEADRWALAFFAGGLSYNQAMRERGAALWNADPATKARFSDLAALTTTTEAVAAQSLGENHARDVMAFLRSYPQALRNPKTPALDLARTQLSQSLSAARAGNWQAATRLGLSAYLDGFEPLEPTLSARKPSLKMEVESQMLAFRAALARENIEQATAGAQRLNALFTEVQAELGASVSDPMSTFIGALTILLREGLEALLIVVGMLAILRKAQRADVVRHVHAGWISALAAGAATWAVATFVVDISGASREVTEGLSSLFAAVVLLGVGLWMHQKSSAGRWQAYLQHKLSAAMSQRSAWALFALAFIAVYREVFETVLFYSALAVDGNGRALLAGLATGIIALTLISWLLLRTSARMPVGKFFSVSSVLVAILAVVLSGKGAAALQEAGWLSSTPIGVPRIEVLGIFPSAQTLIAQLIAFAVAALGFRLNTMSSRRTPKAAQA